MLKNKLLVILIVVLAAFMLPNLITLAQVADLNWTTPFRISARDLRSSEASLVNDDFGYVHAFWAEKLPDDRSIIQYSRYDGEVWTVPISIHISPATLEIESLSTFIDADAYINVYWTEGVLQSYIRLTRAPISEALSSQAWGSALQSRFLAKSVRAVVDRQGVHHVIFSRLELVGRGMFYMNSEDHGLTWSAPVWLDPDIPIGLVPDNLSLVIDKYDTLHATWNYASLTVGSDFYNWVRYARLPAGETKWSYTTIDRVNAEDLANNYQLNLASPVMAVSGDQVVVIWAGGHAGRECRPAMSTRPGDRRHWPG